MKDTTNTKEPTGKSAKQRETPLLVEVDLRDYFAAKAMQGICASGPTDEWTDDRIAVEAYNLADAMLIAREIRP